MVSMGKISDLAEARWRRLGARAIRAIEGGYAPEKSEAPALAFILPCVPTAQARPRHMRTRSGLDLSYKSAAQKANERTLEAMLLPHVPKIAFEGALELRFTAIMPIPSSASKKRKEAMLRGKTGHTVKPDLDNLAKQLKDAMTRMRFWHDDRQVTRLVCEKRYGETPLWDVRLRRIGEER